MYFKLILPTTFFAPAAKKDIFSCPVEEQFDGLLRLYSDACNNYNSNDYLFYNFWTGFLYALSKSNIPELVLFTWYKGIFNSNNHREKMVAAYIWAYFLFWLRFFVKIGDKDSVLKEIPLLRSIMEILMVRGYWESRNKKKMLKEVLEEVAETEWRDLRDFLRLVLDILKKLLLGERMVENTR